MSGTRHLATAFVKLKGSVYMLGTGHIIPVTPHRESDV